MSTCTKNDACSRIMRQHVSLHLGRGVEFGNHCCCFHVIFGRHRINATDKPLLHRSRYSTPSHKSNKMPTMLQTPQRRGGNLWPCWWAESRLDLGFSRSKWYEYVDNRISYLWLWLPFDVFKDMWDQCNLDCQHTGNRKTVQSGIWKTHWLALITSDKHGPGHKKGLTCH